MRVKCHQIRAKVAFTKPLTTHFMRGKGDFSCRVTFKIFEVYREKDKRQTNISRVISLFVLAQL